MYMYVCIYPSPFKRNAGADGAAGVRHPPDRGPPLREEAGARAVQLLIK